MIGKKITVRLVLMYLILTVGIWMFLYSYSNSYNKLNTEKISAAEIVVDKDKTVVRLAGREYTVDTDVFSPESDFYFAAYMLAPTELRFLCTAESAWEKEFGL